MKTFLIKIVGFYINLLSVFSSKYAAVQALLLFSTPRKGRHTEAQSDFLDSAFQEELNYKDTIIMTYRWLGKNKTILLVHGWESNSARWQSLITKLQEYDYNIIALDAPAHGSSSGKQFNALLYSECVNVVVKKFNPSIYVGHSVGGMATVFCYHNYNITNIKKMILLGTPSEIKNVFKRYIHMMSYNKRIQKQISTITFERFGKHLKDLSIPKFLEIANFRGLIIHDKKDPVIPYNEAISINKSFKSSTLITTQNLGHSLNSDIVRTHIVDFITN